jgi:hypothetical protein
MLHHTFQAGEPFRHLPNNDSTSPILRLNGIWRNICKRANISFVVGCAPPSGAGNSCFPDFTIFPGFLQHPCSKTDGRSGTTGFFIGSAGFAHTLDNRITWPAHTLLSNLYYILLIDGFSHTYIMLVIICRAREGNCSWFLSHLLYKATGGDFSGEHPLRWISRVKGLIPGSHRLANCNTYMIPAPTPVP